jgi:hypothetical protein
MSIAIFDITEGAPTSYHLPQREVMAEHPETNQLKHIGYFRGQNTIFLEEIKNKDLKQSKVPDFIFNPERNKCELRFNDRDAALLTYIESHPFFKQGKYVRYSEEIENERKLGKAESIEKALILVSEGDDLRVRALGLAVLGLSSYQQTTGSVKALLKDKAVNKPLEVIKACNDDLFENKFIASLAICSNILKTNNTNTAIIWGDNNGRVLSIATGEDFITKLAQHIGQKSPESEALLQEIGKRLKLSEKSQKKVDDEASEIQILKAKLAQAQEDLEISQSRTKNLTPSKAEQDALDAKEFELLELRDKYTAVTGKELSFKFLNNVEWMTKKIEEAESASVE